MPLVRPDHDVRDVAHSQPVRTLRYEVPDQIRIDRKAVGGIRRPGLPDPRADLQPATVEDFFEPVAPDRRAPGEVPAVHVPELPAANPAVLRPHTARILRRKLLPRHARQDATLVILVIRLLAHAKQSAKVADAIAAGILRMQVRYRLAPAFFRIEIPNFFSATSIISS